MDFFYPNFNNDMWRIIGLIFFGDKSHFEMSARTAAKRFDREKIAGFCAEKGIALYDTAEQVRRLKDNASDKFLEIVTPTDLSALLEKIPECTAIVATGEKAAEAAAAFFGCKAPATGKCIEIITRHLMFWRMPSSSRAYPSRLRKRRRPTETCSSPQASCNHECRRTIFMNSSPVIDSFSIRY